MALTVAGAALPRVSAAAVSSLLRFPYVQNVRQTQAIVRWVTKQAGAGALEYQGDDSQIGRVTSNVQAFLPEETGQAQAYYRHEAVLRKLTPGTNYSYQISLDGQSLTAAAMQFRTAGVAPFQFLAFGDSGTGSAAQKTISQLLLQQSPDFILHTGDLVYPSGTFARYEALYFEYYRDIMKDVPFFPCPGNHDYYEMKCLPYKAANSVPDEMVPTRDAGRYYSFDWGNAHFVSLDSNDCLEEAADGSGSMLEWLEKDLQATTKFWRIVLLHHPAYSAGNHSNEPESELVRKWITPILDKYRIPLVLNGHEHSYQRSLPIRAGQVMNEGDGTVYVTTGGGGAELHPVQISSLLHVGVSEHNYVFCDVNNAKLQLRAHSINGNELDRLVMAPKPFLSASAVVNAADYTPRVAPGSLISLFGFQLSPEEANYTKAPAPKILGQISVTIDGVAAPILMTSGRQVNVQVPFEASGDCDVVLRNGNGSVTTKIQVDPTAPAIFPDSLFHANGAAVSATAPALPGEVLTLYATGLGELSQTAETGTAPDAVPAKAEISVLVNGAAVVPMFAGSVKGSVGIYAIQFRLPLTISAGVPMISLLADKAASNLLNLRWAAAA